MPRAMKASDKSRHNPLYVELDDDELLAKYGRVSQPGKRKKFRNRGEDEEVDEEVILDPKTSKRVFELARDQQEELEFPEDEEVYAEDGRAFVSPRATAQYNESYADDDDDEIQEHDSRVGDAEELFDLDSGDLQTLDNLLPPNSGERKTLADLIFAKLDSVHSGNPAVIDKHQKDGGFPDPAYGLDPKVVEVYTKVGVFLSKYKSGPLPKIFKVIPSLPAWARMLAITHPEDWTPQACRAATRIFISSMKAAQAQLYLEVVLLDAIQEDIRQNKKLNVHYYESLKRALYKPSAFFKGLVFPLLDRGCSLKDAAIVASILARKHVPVLHSSAALLRIANMDYTGPNSLFIRVLVDKKHELPYKVVDALVFHFIRLSNTYKARYRGDSDKLPVLWQQSLLVFCQRYASDLTPDQKDALLDVARATPHPLISPEIRRELVNSVARGEPRPDADVVMT